MARERVVLAHSTFRCQAVPNFKLQTENFKLSYEFFRLKMLIMSYLQVNAR
jgi:hypothetical protein